MKQKRLLLLGGLIYLIPVIEAAHKQGYYVITCDYIQNNIAHKYSDEYHNVSIVDKYAVLRLAKELKIDGIMSFAVDPGVVTAAYVQEKMVLPGNPYKSVEILQNKDKFRNFLALNGFNVPNFKGYSSVEEVLADINAGVYADAHAGVGHFSWPLIVKPTDSAGSKGVTRVNHLNELEPAVEKAFEYSICKRIIIEDFIEKEGYSSDSEGFSVNGKLEFISYSAQRFDLSAANPYTPSAYSWPSTFTKVQKEELTSELQRLLKILDMGTSIYNIEVCTDKNGKAFIMEVSPRGGGNRLAEMLKYITGVDLITNAVRAAVGDKVSDDIGFGVKDSQSKNYNGYWAEVILHSAKNGYFTGLNINNKILKAEMIQEDLWVKRGELVSSFNGANNAIGTLILKFDNEEELKDNLDNISSWLSINVK
ncbi:MAG: ATP-grasp domain-containing protein [Bacteroidales bacterium]